MARGRGGRTERSPESVAERLRGWWRFLYKAAVGARSSIAEEMGFRILLWPAQWGLVLTGLLLVGLPVLLAVTTSYDRGNYRYALSAELQSVAAIFAIVLTGTLVVAQIVVATTPRVMSYLPLRGFIAAVVFNVVTMGTDVVALARLPQSATWIGKLGVNFAVVLNGAALLFTFGYVATALLWTRPKTYLAAVLNRMDQADDVQGQLDGLVAIEELGLHAGERRHVQTCEDATRSVVTAARIILEKPDLSVDEALGDRDHPLRVLLRTLENLGGAWAEEGLDGPVSTIAAALGSIALGYSEYDERLVDAEFPMAMTAIMRSCVRHSREIALYDFLANKRAALTRLEEASAQRALAFWIASIDEEIRLCADSGLGDAAREVVSQLDVLVGAVAVQQIDAAVVRTLLESAESCFVSKGILDYVPVFDQQTLGQTIQATRQQLDQVEREMG